MSLFSNLGAGQIWTQGLTFTSPVNDILDRGDGEFTLEDLLGEDDILAETKAQNDRLIEFLAKEEQLDKMIAYVIDEPPVDASDLRKFKYPFMSCELLCCEVPDILDRFADDPDNRYLNKMFSILDGDHRINNYSAGYLEKLVEMLCRKKTVPMMAYLNSHGEDLLKRFLNHVDNYSVMQIVQRLMLPHIPFTLEALEEEPSPSSQCNWASMPTTCEHLTTVIAEATVPDVPAHIGELLITVVQLSPPDTPFVTNLCATKCVHRLFEGAFPKGGIPLPVPARSIKQGDAAARAMSVDDTNAQKPSATEADAAATAESVAAAAAAAAAAADTGDKAAKQTVGANSADSAADDKPHGTTEAAADDTAATATAAAAAAAAAGTATDASGSGGEGEGEGVGGEAEAEIVGASGSDSKTDGPVGGSSNEAAASGEATAGEGAADKNDDSDSAAASGTDNNLVLDDSVERLARPDDVVTTKALGSAAVLESLLSRLADASSPYEAMEPIGDMQAVLTNIDSVSEVALENIGKLGKELKQLILRNRGARMQNHRPTPTLGSRGLHLVRLAEALVRLSKPQLDEVMIRENVLRSCIELCFKYETNSMLHLSMQRIILLALDGGAPRRDLQRDMLVSCRLLARILEVMSDKDAATDILAGGRRPLIGHLVVMSQAIVQVCEAERTGNILPAADDPSPTTLRDLVEETGIAEEWDAFVMNELSSVVEAQVCILAGAEYPDRHEQDEVSNVLTQQLSGAMDGDLPGGMSDGVGAGSGTDTGASSTFGGTSFDGGGAAADTGMGNGAGTGVGSADMVSGGGAFMEDLSQSGTGDADGTSTSFFDQGFAGSAVIGGSDSGAGDSGSSGAGTAQFGQLSGVDFADMAADAAQEDSSSEEGEEEEEEEQEEADESGAAEGAMNATTASGGNGGGVDAFADFADFGNLGSSGNGATDASSSVAAEDNDAVLQDAPTDAEADAAAAAAIAAVAAGDFSTLESDLSTGLNAEASSGDAAAAAAAGDTDNDEPVSPTDEATM